MRCGAVRCVACCVGPLAAERESVGMGYGGARRELSSSYTEGKCGGRRGEERGLAVEAERGEG